MNIAILSHQIPIYFYDRLKIVGEKFKHQVRFIQLSYCYMNISARAPTVYYRSNETFQDLDAIVPRIFTANTLYGSSVLRQFERMGVYTVNQASAITLSRDKLRALQHLAKHQIPLPITGSADAPPETEKLVELVGGAPLVVRLLGVTQGKDTIFAETHLAAISVVNAFKQLKTNILVQEYIKEAEGRDIRCLVVGNKVVVSVIRMARPVGTGARNINHTEAQIIKITPEEKKLVLATAKAMKLNFACIDIIRSKRGPLVLEVDPVPNVEWMEHITGVDVITPLIHFIEENVKKSNPEKN